MKQFTTLFLFEFYESIRSKWFYVNGFSFIVFSFFLMEYGQQRIEASLSGLFNLTLLVLPLFSLLFGSISFSESLSFFGMVLTRDVSRTKLFLAKFFGLGFGLSISYMIGILAIYFSYFGLTGNLFLLFLVVFFGILLIHIFLAISFLLSSLLIKKEILYAIGIFLWVYFYILYDLIIIAFSVIYREYPLEIPVLILLILNPITLVRSLFLLQLNLSSLMGFGTAIFQKILGGDFGIIFATSLLFIWIFIPLAMALMSFKKKNL